MYYLFLAALCTSAMLVLLAEQRLATKAFLFGCLYSPAGVGFSLLGFNFPFFRFLAALALIRILARGEYRSVVRCRLDVIVILLFASLIVTSLFHAYEAGSGPIYTLGIVLNSIGAYFIFRVFTSAPNAVVQSAQMLPWLLFPIAVLMVLEQLHATNYFALVSSLPSEALVRDGRVRSLGPFSHPILAGTIGAAFFPFIVAIWDRKVSALVHSISCLTIVFTSASSGPLLSLIAVCSCLALWKYRQYFKYLYLIPLIGYVLLLGVMSRSPYYLIADANLVGGSTGWYRAYLIEATIKHFGEWWLIGTDRTIHWIPFQPGISMNHADITNNFIVYAIMGGISALLLFVWMNWHVYRISSISLASTRHSNDETPRVIFLLWASFCGFFATFFSVSLFDQAQMFYWMIVAMIANVAELRPQNSSALPVSVTPTVVD